MASNRAQAYTHASNHGSACAVFEHVFVLALHLVQSGRLDQCPVCRLHRVWVCARAGISVCMCVFVCMWVYVVLHMCACVCGRAGVCLFVGVRARLSVQMSVYARVRVCGVLRGHGRAGVRVRVCACMCQCALMSACASTAARMVHTYGRTCAGLPLLWVLAHAHASVHSGPSAFQSKVLKERFQWMDTHLQIKTEEYLSFDALRHASQCIGRVLRNKADYGLMILADKRYSRIDKRGPCLGPAPVPPAPPPPVPPALRPIRGLCLVFGLRVRGGGRPGQRMEEQGTWGAQKHSEAGYGRPVDRGVWTAKTVKRPRQQPAHPQYANYWAPLTRKRHTMPHSAQSQHTNYWAPRTRKRHQQEHRPQRPTESSDPTQHAKGRTGDRPGPRKGATTRRNVTQGGVRAPILGLSCLALYSNFMVSGAWVVWPAWIRQINPPATLPVDKPIPAPYSVNEARHVPLDGKGFPVPTTSTTPTL